MPLATLDAATVDLLGVCAYGELTAFERLASDAQLAPTVEDKIALATMANAEFAHFRQLHDHLAARGVDPVSAMAPFVEPLDAFHDSTQPADWYEGLIKAYVGDGMATDFYREVATYVKDEETRLLLQSVLSDTGQAEFAVARVKEIIAQEPSVGGRLALWARRLVGEALIQAQQVAVERDALLELLVGSGDLAGIMRLLKSITDKHEDRMGLLGLQA
ncbi:MAG: ferritin-like fold-containing protein [Nocardioides sp.]